MDEWREIRLYPGRYTPLKDEEGLVGLEDVQDALEEVSGDGFDDSQSTGNQSGAAKTITFTIGGLAIGIAVGAAGATMLTPPPPMCPQPVTQTQTSQPTTPKPIVPAPTGGTKATTSATSAGSASSAQPAPAASSSDGTL